MAQVLANDAPSQARKLGQNVRNIASEVESVLAAIVSDMGTRTDEGIFEEFFETYHRVIDPHLKRYHHHSGHVGYLDSQYLRIRYQYETGILAIFRHVIANKLLNSAGYKVDAWLLDTGSNLFGWYSMPAEITAHVTSLFEDDVDYGELALSLSELGGHLIKKCASRYHCEHYTPVSIADHLIELSGFQPSHVIEGQRIVDPACGGGIILATITRQVVREVLSGRSTCQQAINALSSNLYGFDIQPFAVALTRTLLLCACLPLLTSNAVVVSRPLFPNVRQLDPIVALADYWNSKDGFQYIIGNPPFMSVKKAPLSSGIESYDAILDGHPNLYQLFLWWAVQSAAPGGVVSFLVPQSLLAGTYYRSLRRALEGNTDLLSITRMTDSTGVVDDVEHQMMALCFQVNSRRSIKPNVAVRVTRNGNSISESAPLSVPFRQFVDKIKSTTMWVVSDNALDYAIVEQLEAQCVTLGNLRDEFEYGNGEYVWNQHKDLLLDREQDGSLPLVSAASIVPFSARFPYEGAHPCSHRSFSRVDSTVHSIVHTGPILIIQRTTPRKQGRRLVTGMLSSDFCAQYSGYFLENHINYVTPPSESELDALFGLMGWLNSDIVNFVFQLRNGTSHISLFEFGHLPVHKGVLHFISCYTKMIAASSSTSRKAMVEVLNDAIMHHLNLESKYRRRVRGVLDREPTLGAELHSSVGPLYGSRR